MGSWTPRIIQGGKTDAVPSFDPETDAFLRAFIEAGREEEMLGTLSFENLEGIPPIQYTPEIPQAIFTRDEFGSPVIRFP